MTSSPPDYPAPSVPVGHVEPVPRRVRALRGDRVVVDTTGARYRWEIPYYPRWELPAGDVEAGLGEPVGAGWVHVPWDSVDTWFEEDEQVFVHPRSPYVRVDALRSSRAVRVELDGIVLAESTHPVLVFETGLPTRYYLDRADVRIDGLTATDTVTACPYKGITSEYWSVRTPKSTVEDIAWSYHYPTRELQPIAGLIAFYNERVDLIIDGRPLGRPHTHFSSDGH